MLKPYFDTTDVYGRFIAKSYLWKYFQEEFSGSYTVKFSTPALSHKEAKIWKNAILTFVPGCKVNMVNITRNGSDKWFWIAMKKEHEAMFNFYINDIIQKIRHDINDTGEYSVAYAC